MDIVQGIFILVGVTAAIVYLVKGAIYAQENWLPKLKRKSNSVETSIEQAKYSLGMQIANNSDKAINELNHIKGQLQTIQQELIAVKFEQNGSKPVTTVDPIYLESLAALSKASQTILERQSKIESMLVVLVNKLKELTNT